MKYKSTVDYRSFSLLLWIIKFFYDLNIPFLFIDSLFRTRNAKICDPILETLLKIRPHYIQSSRKLSPHQAVPSAPPSLPRGMEAHKNLSLNKSKITFGVYQLLVKPES